VTFTFPLALKTQFQSIESDWWTHGTATSTQFRFSRCDTYAQETTSSYSILRRLPQSCTTLLCNITGGLCFSAVPDHTAPYGPNKSTKRRLAFIDIPAVLTLCPADALPKDWKVILAAPDLKKRRAQLLGYIWVMSPGTGNPMPTPDSDKKKELYTELINNCSETGMRSSFQSFPHKHEREWKAKTPPLSIPEIPRPAL
jgi:hypothetical protein